MAREAGRCRPRRAGRSRLPPRLHGRRADGADREPDRRHPDRPCDAAHARRFRRGRVENEDTASAIVRFASGAQGTLCTSRAAWGRKNRLDWEVHGTRGTLLFSQERLNELQLYVNEGPAGRQGFRTILTGPAHAPYGAFCPAPGHQLGFGDLKTIEAASMLRAIAGGPPARPNFTDALAYEAVIHAIDDASRTGQRVTLQTS
ncbi:Gfo/Idh/MocA family oxidoreductase [Aurantimonas manganoxydans]|uniref:Gfo/Idh/MocA family protein n=1 Tax=Aurantimonas manganoxydans TaxID=651183 RepID=UPI001FCB46D0|nr:Gfo/Idh/MocA family oxidoreductase [Aurantimonas manganoxydans]